MIICDTQPRCRVCDEILDDENWSNYHMSTHRYIYKQCQRDKHTEWRDANASHVKQMAANHRKQNSESIHTQNVACRRRHGSQSKQLNKSCSRYLGEHVAESVLSNVFTNVHVMPNNNPGYDFVCNCGHRVDVKSACLGIRGRWTFNINRNKIADYFLMLAFDNRADLNPKYMWLIPGDVVSNKVGIDVAATTLTKWREYELPLDKVVSCCNVLKRK